MSERELREGAIQKSLDGSWVCVFCLQHSDEVIEDIEHSEDCPLADEPDVVGLLRDVYALLADAQYQDSEDILGLRCDYTAGITHAYNVLRDKLERIACLTETGWEYVDE